MKLGRPISKDSITTLSIVDMTMKQNNSELSLRVRNDENEIKRLIESLKDKQILINTAIWVIVIQTGIIITLLLTQLQR